MMTLRLAAVALACPCLFLLASCSADVGSGGTDDAIADDDNPAADMVGSSSEGLTLTTPIPMRSGAWWGDVSTPLVNQLWGDVLNAVPEKNITEPYTFKWTCNLPAFAGFSQTLKLSHAMFQFNGGTLMNVNNPLPGATQSYTLDPAAFPAGWGEVRIRCHAKETQGPNAGNTTAITAGFAVQIRGGTGNLSWGPHSGKDYVDTHGWYDRGVGYVYATIRNVSDLVGKSLSGVVALDLKASVSGDTVLDHFMVKLDGTVAKMADGAPAEFHGTTGTRTIYIDTRGLPNGTHTLAMHCHGLETASSEQPGKQLAAQVEVSIDVRN